MKEHRLPDIVMQPVDFTDQDADYGTQGIADPLNEILKEEIA